MQRIIYTIDATFMDDMGPLYIGDGLCLLAQAVQGEAPQYTSETEGKIELRGLNAKIKIERKDNLDPLDDGYSRECRTDRYPVKHTSAEREREETDGIGRAGSLPIEDYNTGKI